MSKALNFMPGFVRISYVQVIFINTDWTLQVMKMQDNCYMNLFEHRTTMCNSFYRCFGGVVANLSNNWLIADQIWVALWFLVSKDVAGQWLFSLLATVSKTTGAIGNMRCFSCSSRFFLWQGQSYRVAPRSEFRRFQLQYVSSFHFYTSPTINWWSFFLQTRCIAKIAGVRQKLQWFYTIM